MTDTDQGAAAVPAVAAAQAVPAGAATTSPAAHGLNVKQMMQQHVAMMGQIHDAQMALLATALQKQRDTVSTAVQHVAGKIDDQTSEFLSIMGEFSNDLGLD